MILLLKRKTGTSDPINIMEPLGTNYQTGKKESSDAN